MNIALLVPILEDGKISRQLEAEINSTKICKMAY